MGLRKTCEKLQLVIMLIFVLQRRNIPLDVGEYAGILWVDSEQNEEGRYIAIGQSVYAQDDIYKICKPVPRREGDYCHER